MKEVSQNKGFSAAKIDSVKISTCVHAWVKFKHYRFAYDLLTETATDFINRKNELYPEYVLFAKVIESLCRVGNVERAEELLRLYWKAFESTPRRRSRPPAIVSCKTILDAWCALDRPDMAEAFLLQMDSLHQTGKITEKTDSEMFEKVVHAWEKSKFHDKYSHARSLKNTMRRRFGNIWNGPKKSMARHLFNK